MFTTTTLTVLTTINALIFTVYMTQMVMQRIKSKQIKMPKMFARK